MRETPNLKLRMFDDTDTFHLADLNHNLNALNTTQEQKSTYFDHGLAQVSYKIGAATETTYENISWTIHRANNKKVVLYTTYTLVGADFRRAGYDTYYSSFDYFNSLRIYFPDIIKSSNQIEHLSVIAMSDADRVWMTGNRLEDGTDSSDIFIRMQSAHQHNTGQGQSGIIVTITVYAEGHLEDYDGTFGLPMLLGSDMIDYSTFNSVFNTFTGDSPIVEKRNGCTYVKMGTLEYLNVTSFQYESESMWYRSEGVRDTDVYDGVNHYVNLNVDEDLTKWLFIGLEYGTNSLSRSSFMALGHMNYADRKINVYPTHYNDGTVFSSIALRPRCFLFVRKG